MKNESKEKIETSTIILVEEKEASDESEVIKNYFYFFLGQKISKNEKNFSLFLKFFD